MKKHPIKFMLKLTGSALIILGLFACNKQADSPEKSVVQSAFSAEIDQKLTPHLDHIVSSYDLPGLVLGMVKDNEVVYAKAFGYRNIETKEPVTTRDLFHMASISKPFVASAIMQLVEQGKVALDSSVIHYLPYFRLEGENYQKITIKQMLNHISGMPDVEDYQWENPEYSEDAIEQYVRSISSEKMQSIPGENFAYSNMAFECLGDVIAKVSGMSFADYQKSNLLDPSGMKESTFLKPDYLPENWAAPHVRSITSEAWTGYPYNRRHGPSSTLHSNVMEMCNWAIINMNRGTFNDQKILNSESYDQLWNPWFEIGEESHIGLSWFISTYQGEKTIGHSGGDIGFSTNLIMLPEKSMAVVVMSNQSPAPVEMVTHTALDIMLGHEPAGTAIPASLPVTRELAENGLNAAVVLWDSLQANHADQYDFDPQHFSGLYVALFMDQVEEAELLTRLCVKIFPDEIKDYLIEETEGYLQNDPENQAGPAMLKVLREGS